MQRIILILVVSIATVVSNPPLHAQTDMPAAPATVTVYRTIIAHELTALPPDPSIGGIKFADLSLSGNGQQIAYWQQASFSPTEVYVVSFDGANHRKVDTPPTSPASLDFADNGTLLLEGIYSGYRLVALPGGGVTPINLVVTGIQFVEISGDGQTVYFNLPEDQPPYGAPPDAVRLERGIYRVNVDGAGLTQIVGSTQVAPLIGAAPGTFTFDSDTGPRSSVDGQRLVFGLRSLPNSMAAVFAVNRDGSGLRLVAELPGGRLPAYDLSGDGATIYYYEIDSAPTYLHHFTAFEGAPLRTISISFAEMYNSQRPYLLSHDGGYFLAGSSSYRYDLATGNRIKMAARGCFDTSQAVPKTLVLDGWGAFAMSSDAQRFVHVVEGVNGANQLAATEINPGAANGAPIFSALGLTPQTIAPFGGAPAALAFHMASPDVLINLGSRTFLAGNSVNDFPMFEWPLTADGNYTAQLAPDGAEQAPHLLRLVADVYHEATGKRHATSVEFGPLYIGGGATPQRLTIDHTVGRPGSVLVVAGEGYWGGATATITINGRSLGAVPVDSDGQIGFLLDTSQANAGLYAVTVSASPEQTVGFRLDSEATLHPRDQAGRVLAVPPGLGFTQMVYLPSVTRSP